MRDYDSFGEDEKRRWRHPDATYVELDTRGISLVPLDPRDRFRKGSGNYITRRQYERGMEIERERNARNPLIQR